MSVRAWLLVVAAGGCGDNQHAAPIDAPQHAPVFRHPVSLPDDDLAREAFGVLGACERCHGLTEQRLRRWSSLTDTALATCLTDLDVTTPAAARAMIDCTRAMPAVTSSDVEPRKLGVFSTAAHLPWFAYVFDVAYGPDAPARLAEFRDLAAMPRGGPALAQAQFDLVAEWFVRGLPSLDRVLVEDPPPSTCAPNIAPAVAAHVAAMQTQGWGAINANEQLAMFPVSGFPRIAAWELSGRGVVRALHDASYATSFWTRSSADGRFVAHGVSNVPGSYVIDLQRDATIPIDADYDPAFFPDHSGFVFQGGPNNTCAIAVLTSNPSSIAMTEPGCRSVTSIGLYEQVGKMLGGGDYITLDSLFVSDDGGKLPTLADPSTSFVASASSTLTPMTFDGTGYVPGPTISIATPFEGDTVLSPSARLSIARLSGPEDRQLGYVLRAIDASFGATEIARYCATGGKPAFSFDERWIAFHHYVGRDDAVELGFASAADPAFAPYLERGAANLYLLELSTGTVRRITNMPAGSYALFPHFRSDGWLYAQVREPGHETTIASDAALLPP